MDSGIVIAIVGVLIMPFLIIQIQKRIKRLRSGPGEETVGSKINLNSILLIGLVLTVMFILFGVVFGSLYNF